MQRIGHRIPAGTEALRWHNLSSAEGTEYFYDERAGMEYEYAHDLGILAANHEDVGQITYYRCGVDEFDALLVESAPSICRECDSPTHREDAHG